MNCQKCGAEIPEESLFCPECGEKQEKEVNVDTVEQKLVNEPILFCKNCGAPIAVGDAFCQECGTPQQNVGQQNAGQQAMGMPQQTMGQQTMGMPQQTMGQQAMGMPQQAYYQQQYQQPKTPMSKKTKAIIGVAIGAVAAMLVAVFVLLFVKFPIDLNKYVDITFEGYNTVGTAKVNIDYDKFEKKYKSMLKAKNCTAEEFFEDYVVYDLDKRSGLSNGDKVTLEWKCEDKAVKDRFGYKLKYSDIEAEVENLKEAETFDPFKDIKLEFAGISPNGEASITGTCSEVEGLEFRLSQEYALKEGDSVDVTVSASTGDDVIEYCIEKCGKIPSQIVKSYKIEGLDKYVTKRSDINETEMKKMQKQAEDEYKSRMMTYWDDDEKLASMTYIGNYLLTSKDESSYTRNKIYLVYKIKVKNSASGDGKKYNKTNTIYWWISFDNLVVKADGTLSINLTYNDVPYDEFVIESGVRVGWVEKKWRYKGYRSLEELYNRTVIANAADFNAEENVNEKVSDSDKKEIDDSKAGTEEGIIFANSSKELISNDDIKKLSDEDLRMAINEIYAREGYIFDNEEIGNYYKQYDWYKPSIAKDDFKDTNLNSIEYKNVTNLKKERDKRKK